MDSRGLGWGDSSECWITSMSQSRIWMTDSNGQNSSWIPSNPPRELNTYPICTGSYWWNSWLWSHGGCGRCSPTARRLRHSSPKPRNGTKWSAGRALSGWCGHQGLMGQRKRKSNVRCYLCSANDMVPSRSSDNGWTGGAKKTTRTYLSCSNDSANKRTRPHKMIHRKFPFALVGCSLNHAGFRFISDRFYPPMTEPKNPPVPRRPEATTSGSR